MDTKTNKRFFQLGISSWYILVLCAVSAFITSYLFSIYGVAHWKLMRTSYNLKSHIESISNNEKASLLIKENGYLKVLFDDLPDISEKFHTAGADLMHKAAMYHITGLVSFALSIFAFFCRPRWVGFIGLPVGIYALILALTMM